MECINITNLEYNKDAIRRRKAGAIFIQEHKLKGKALKETTEYFKDEGWDLKCGPCDESTNKNECGRRSADGRRQQDKDDQSGDPDRRFQEVGGSRKSWQI